MNRLLFSPITAFIISLLAIFFWFSLYQTTQEIRNSSEDTKNIREGNKSLTLEIQSLEEEILLAKDPESKEKIVRDELLMQKTGEYILKLPDIETLRHGSGQVLEEVQEPSIWEEWQKLLY